MNLDELILNYCAITNTNKNYIYIHICGNSPIEVSRKFLFWFSILRNSWGRLNLESLLQISATVKIIETRQTQIQNNS